MAINGAFLPLYVQILGNLLFCFVFLFLWRQSGVVYFAYWGLAWSVEAIALGFSVLGAWTGSTVWLGFHALLEFGFALSLLAAARVGRSRGGRTWASAIRALLLFPVVLLIIYLLGWHRRPEEFDAVHCVVLSGIFFYSFFTLGDSGSGLGGKLFRFTLLSLAMLFLHHAAAHFYVHTRGGPPAWMAYMRYASFYDFALQTLLAFSTMAMWIESQNERLTHLTEEVERVRREASNLDLDGLTGLLNRSVLEKRMEDPAPFAGVVSVCDLDNFKAINDLFGHLTGDEILRHIGNLLRTSVRQEDEAFRWGGDEFVILFHNQHLPVAKTRMTALEQRLKDFGVRGRGIVPIAFSWGAAEGTGQTLRPVLDEADREMYTHKRRRSTRM